MKQSKSLMQSAFSPFVGGRGLTDFLRAGFNPLDTPETLCGLDFSLINKKCAFTLAEVLITLGIIGVVAVVTLPTLIKNYQKQVLVNQLKKSYSTLSQGIKKMMADELVSTYGETSFFNTCQSDLEKCESMFNKYFKANNYEYESGRSYPYLLCYSNEYCVKSNLSSNNVYGHKFYLSDGSIVYVNNESFIGATRFIVDVNGEKNPNIFGRDIFIFLAFANKNGELEAQDSTFTEYIKTCNSFNHGICSSYIYVPEITSGYGAKKIIQDGWKMNY